MLAQVLPLQGREEGMRLIRDQWYRTHRPQGAEGAHTHNAPTVSSAPGPSPATQNDSALTLTTSDGTKFHMADFMKVVMEQMKTTHKVLSKDEESETTKRLRLAEAEVN